MLIDMLVYFGLALATVLAALLLLPYSLSAWGRLADGVPAVGGSLRWAWGLASLSYEEGQVLLRLLGVRAYRFRRTSKEAKAPKKRSKRRRGLLAKASRLRHWVLRLARAVDLHLRVEGRIGLDDPSNTALLHQVLELLSYLRPWVRMNLSVDYLDENVDIAANLRARIWIVLISMLVIGMLLSTFARGLWERMRASSTPEHPVGRNS